MQKYTVIPAQAGIRTRPHGNLYPVIPTNLHPVIPTKAGIYRESRNFSAVIPAQAGIRTRPHGNLHPVIPTKVGI